MKYGYCRVSTRDQSNEKFIEPLKAEGVDPANIVMETISGTKTWRRRELGKLVYRCEPGDSIIVPELSRLGRGAADVLDLRDELMHRNITVHTLKEGYRIGARMRAADKMIVTVMAAVNEMERDYISDRTVEGLAHAKASGKVLGGYRGKNHERKGEKRNEHPHRAEILRQVADGVKIARVARRFNVSRTAIYNWRRETP